MSGCPTWLPNAPAARPPDSAKRARPPPNPPPPCFITRSFAGFSCNTAAFVRLLCKCGADARAADAAGRTPLMAAVREVGYGWHAVDAAAVLLAHGADPRAADAAGATALHHAGAGSADACLYYGSDGGDGGATYSIGRGGGAAEELAEDASKLRSIVRLLLSAGADPAARDAAGRTPMGAAVDARNAVAVLALANEGVPLLAPAPAELALRMAQVCAGAQRQGLAAAGEAAALRGEVDALRAQLARMEAEQLSSMGPGLRALIVGAAAEVKRLQEARGAPPAAGDAGCTPAAAGEGSCAPAAASDGGRLPPQEQRQA